jgi:hypothetical protein
MVLLQVLLGACTDVFKLDIQIGDFAHYRELWDKQNMLDYQLNIERFDYSGPVHETNLIIQNGYLVNPDPLWPDVYPSTVPELFSLIEEILQRDMERSKNGFNGTLRLHASYNEDYYYPEQIYSSFIKTSYSSSSIWTISLEPMYPSDYNILKLTH